MTSSGEGGASSSCDHDCNGWVTTLDYATFFGQLGAPLPEDSGLSCAGLPPCVF